LVQVVEVAVGLGEGVVVVGVELDSLLQVAEGKIGLAAEGLGTGYAVVGIGIISFDDQGSFKAGLGFCNALELEENDAAITVANFASEATL
jgi:hypothetical protein